MTTLRKMAYVLLIPVFSLSINGCGGGSDGGGMVAIDTTSVQSGSVVQSPVGGATVFADNVASGSRFNQDGGEVAAQTDPATGKFFLPSFPTYDFVLVSTGGTDKTTGRPALIQLAPAGSANVTPLTTLVTFDTSKRLKPRLEALMGGAKFDANIAATASPAIQMLISSVETAVHTVSEAIRKAAADSGNSITQKQINQIQIQAWREIALALAAADTAALATPAGLHAALQAALNNAIATIKNDPNNSNISSFDFSASVTIANNTLNAVMTAMNTGQDRTSTAALSTSNTPAGSVPSGSSTILTNAVTSMTTTLAAENSVSINGGTPNPYAPPPVTVVTTTTTTIIAIITGSGGGNGGVGVSF